MVAILSPTAEYFTFITQIFQTTADYTEKSDLLTLQAGSTLIWYFHAQLPSSPSAKGLQMPLTTKITSSLPLEQRQAITYTFVHKEAQSTYPNRVRLLSTVTQQSTQG